MEDKKYYVHAKFVMHFNFPITATSKKKAIAELKENLENGYMAFSDGNPNDNDYDSLYAFDASEVDSHEEDEF
jgi:hypothetical protein|tara:strand:- start:83 stop:301 length:219 start_codon:yes stop_codon:yes gene_type:complete